MRPALSGVVRRGPVAIVTHKRWAPYRDRVLGNRSAAHRWFTETFVRPGWSTRKGEKTSGSQHCSCACVPALLVCSGSGRAVSCPGGLCQHEGKPTGVVLREGRTRFLLGAASLKTWRSLRPLIKNPSRKEVRLCFVHNPRLNVHGVDAWATTGTGRWELEIHN